MRERPTTVDPTGEGLDQDPCSLFRLMVLCAEQYNWVKFSPLPANALARVVGCLTKSGAGWVVTSATTPERAERAVAGGEDAARPLGSRTIGLKFVITRLDTLAGSRVAVSGLLIGEGGVDGINVTAVNRVAPKCP